MWYIFEVIQYDIFIGPLILLGWETKIPVLKGKDNDNKNPGIF